MVSFLRVLVGQMTVPLTPVMVVLLMEKEASRPRPFLRSCEKSLEWVLVEERSRKGGWCVGQRRGGEVLLVEV